MRFGQFPCMVLSVTRLLCAALPAATLNPTAHQHASGQAAPGKAPEYHFYLRECDLSFQVILAMHA